MKYGLDEQGKYWIEYTSCPRPVGNMRQELDLACQRIASQRPTMISLSSGLDSQIVLHSFVEQGLDHECAFLYHPGFNDSEFENVKILEKKYGFKSHVITIDAMAVKEQAEALAESTRVPPQHHVKTMFFDQLDDSYQILEGPENPDLFLDNGRWRMMESYNAIDTTANWFHAGRRNPVVHLDRRSQHQEFAISILIDDIAQAYRHAFPYIRENGMVDAKTGKVPLWVIWGWGLYIKPIQFGKYWGNELEYFPKFASQKEIEYMADPRVIHDYLKRVIFIDLERHLDVMCDWGSNRTIKYTQTYDRDAKKL
jgi:hypothetical protein